MIGEQWNIRRSVFLDEDHLLAVLQCDRNTFFGNHYNNQIAIDMVTDLFGIIVIGFNDK